jgi:hypothetical protein
LKIGTLNMGLGARFLFLFLISPFYNPGILIKK